MLENLGFPYRQITNRILLGTAFVQLDAVLQRIEGAHQFAGHFGADCGFACHRSHNGGGHCVAVHGLQQITACAAAQRRSKIVCVFADREHQHACLWRGFLEAG